MKDKYDQVEFYCPKLGHHLTFKYCRSENLGIPCARIAKCCSDKIPVEDFINTNYSLDERKQIFVRPEPKMNSILSIIQQVSHRDN